MAVKDQATRQGVRLQRYGLVANGAADGRAGAVSEGLRADDPDGRQPDLPVLRAEVQAIRDALVPRAAR